MFLQNCGTGFPMILPWHFLGWFENVGVPAKKSPKALVLRKSLKPRKIIEAGIIRYARSTANTKPSGLLAYQVSQIESCLRSSHPAIKRSTAVLCITREFVIWIQLHRFAQLYVLCFCCVCKFRLVGVGEVHVSAWLCSIYSLSAPSRHPFSCSVSRSLKCVKCVMLAESCALRTKYQMLWRSKM